MAKSKKRKGGSANLKALSKRQKSKKPGHVLNSDEGKKYRKMDGNLK